MTYLMVFFRLFVEFKLSSQMVSSIECQLITYLLAQASLFFYGAVRKDCCYRLKKNRDSFSLAVPVIEPRHPIV